MTISLNVLQTLYVVLMMIGAQEPFVAGTYIRITARTHLTADRSKYTLPLTLLRQWRLRASRCLLSVPIPTKAWYDIITSITGDRNPKRWSPDQGHVQ
jgi:hypothetical protein